MKNIFLVTIFAFMISGTAFAQDQDKIIDANYCILLDGKVFKQYDGEIALLKKSLELKNGTVVNADGSYVLKDNKKMKLNDGECLGFSGKFYASQQKLNAELYKQYRKQKK